MSKTYVLTLDGINLEQVLAELRARETSWRKTAEYLRSGYYATDDSFLAEDRTSDHEADRTALFYARMIRSLERQREEPLTVERELYLQGKADGQDALLQRTMTNWNLLQRMPPVAVRRRLLELRDEICD